MTPQQTDQERSAIKVQRWIFAFYLVFVVYGSLVPLDFRNRPVGEAFGILLGLRDQPLNFSSRTDWATNLMLFIPLTFLAMQGFASRSTGLVKLLMGVLVVVLGGTLAVAIEFTQIFFPSRTPSQNDIVALSIGSAIGVAAQWWLGGVVEQWIKGYWSRQRSEEKVARLLKGYLFILLGFSVLPLDLTISPVEVYHKWREGHVILLPFGGLKGGVADMLYQVLTDILIWIPAGLLWALQRRQGIWRVARDGLLAGAVVELLQLFVMSRTTDITSVLMAGAGSALGAWLAQRPGRKGQISGGAWRVWWCVWALLVLATFWFPFDFEASRFSFDALQQAFLRAPLTTYYGNSELMAVNELLRKVGFFIPGGALLAMAHSTRKRPSASTMRPYVMLMLVAFLVEFGQIMLPGKVADLTDMLFETFGGALGYWIGRWVASAGDALPAEAPTVASRSAPLPSAPAPARSPSPPPRPMTQPRPTAHAPVVPRRRLASYKPHLWWLLATMIVLGIALKLPFVPYNVRELAEPGLGGIVSVIGLSLAIHWIANGPFLILTPARRIYLLLLPLTLLGHGLVSWVLLRVSVPMESIYDIVGSPTMGWIWEFELIGRYLALHAALMLQVLGAVLFVRFLVRISTMTDFVYWLMMTVVLTWPLYTVVIDWAGTDNLVELIGDNASFLSSSCIVFGFLLTCVTAGALAAAVFCPPRRMVLLVVVLVAGAGATAMYYLGAEHVLVKYGKAFSAFQFLLSSDRAHYAHGMDLMVRYIAAFTIVTLGLACLQSLAWRDRLRQDQHEEEQRRALRHARRSAVRA